MHSTILLPFYLQVTGFINKTVGIYGYRSLQVLDRIIHQQELMPQAIQDIALELALPLRRPGGAWRTPPSECDVGADGILLGIELRHCSKLILPDLILHTLLNSTSLPEIYGSCGELVAVEYASPEDMKSGIFDQRPWTKRVELAIALLDYIQRLEHTPYGTLYLCDLQWKNLGVLKGSDGRTIIKSIDNDKSFFGDAIQRKLNRKRSCAEDHDCRVVGCSVECNLTTHTCSKELSSNNLQVYI